MDPQIRLFLEIAWETLEQTGYLPKHYSGIGVYAGTGSNTYYKKISYLIKKCWIV
jgi:acyl transferase domain-containing protein